MPYLIFRSFGILTDVRSNQCWITTRDHFLCISDLVNQRSLLLLATILATTEKQKIIPPTNVLLNVFKWGDSILMRHGNEGYDLIKMWEPLLNGTILTNSGDKYLDSDRFYNKMVAEYCSTFEEHKESLRDDIVFLEEQIVRPCMGNPNFLTQIFGLFRIWGHPSIDGIRAVNRLARYGRANRIMNEHSILYVTNKWREYFSIGFYIKHHRWPSMSFTGGFQSYLIKSLINGNTIDRNHPDYDLNDWIYIVFEKTFSLPNSYDFCDIITDKSLSLNSDDLKDSLISDGTIGHNRSVIIKTLENIYETPSEFLKKIEKEGFPLNNNVLGLHPKEREMKILSRLFGLMPLEKRLFIVLTEAMVANDILPCFPEITITYSERALKTKLHSVTKTAAFKQTADSEYIDVIVGLDFQKWNTNMRNEETLPMLDDIDRLYGLKNCFTRGHNVFTDTSFYLADGTITPKVGVRQVPKTRFEEEPRCDSDPSFYPHPVVCKGCYITQYFLLDSDGVYNGNIGGMEGMRQKVWTIFTVTVLKLVAEKSNAKVQIVGQGDNQVLVVSYPKISELPVQEQHEDFMNNLEAFVETIGPPLKEEECWASSTFFSYGKFPILNGSPLSTSMKKLCRCSRLNNDNLMNIDSAVGGISANASEASKLSHSPDIPYLVAKYETLGAFLNYVRYPIYHSSNLLTKLDIDVNHVFVPTASGKKRAIPFSLNENFIKLLHDPMMLSAALSIVPPVLGGYSSVQFNDLLLHGFPDPLTLTINENRRLFFQLPEEYNYLKFCMLSMLNPQFNLETNYELLLENPTSLNLNVCSRPKDLVKTKVFQTIPKLVNVRNEEFQQMFTIAVQQQPDLVSALSTMRPYRAKVASEIYSSTLISQAKKTVNRINKTSTLINLTAKHLDSIDVSSFEEVLFGMDEPRKQKPLYTFIRCVQN